ncbi:KilA-N domain-containing protein [Nostoc sp. XA010]|nr:KilA-N domain-containing protein [Nostoc sp. XA010]
MKTDGENEFRGTYIHSLIAIVFAQWCNPKFALWVSQQMRNGRDVRQWST